MGKPLQKLLIENSDERKNAIDKFISAPPLLESKYQIFRYTKSEADYLQSHYHNNNLVIGKLINNNSQLMITSLEVHELPEKIEDDIDSKFVVLAVAKKSKEDRYIEYLDEMTIRLNIPHPFDVLRQRHEYLNNNQIQD